MSQHKDKSANNDTPIESNAEESNVEKSNADIRNVFTDSLVASHKKLTASLIPSKVSPSQFNRRRFIRGVGVGVVGSAGLGLVGCGSDSNGWQGAGNLDKAAPVVDFAHGVASGDPLADRVILWTRVTLQANTANQNTSASSTNIDVQWIMATDTELTDIVAHGNTVAQASKDYTVKVDVDGLIPNRIYYYQFSAGEQLSRVGKTKTLPVDDVEQVKLAVFSCANYPAGFFHVYADAAKRNDLDACVHLGDYIYEYGRTTTTAEGQVVPAYASANAASIKREVEPPTEIIGINEYRRRYAQYRTDPDLQDLHACIPMIAVWDDHELANDAYENGAENHQPDEGPWDKRKLAAVVAYHEWMPIRNSVPSEIYRRFDFGNLLSLHMLDTRVIGRDEQLNYGNFIKPDANGNLFVDAEGFYQSTNDPERQLLGLSQANWLVNQLQDSTAIWQILGQQVLMARMLLPAPIILNIVNPSLGVGFVPYMGIVNKARTAPQTLTLEEQAILQQPSVPYNLDAWDGYGSARELVLNAADKLEKNLVVLSGDTHNAWASNLTNEAGKAVGVEFATSSVTSPGFEDYLPDIPPSTLQAVLPQIIPDLQYMDPNQRGYMVITATPSACTSEWVFVSDILQQTYSSDIGQTLSVNIGENQLAM